GEFDNPYRYAGYYYDIETDNYYLISRYYNPKIARFISEDSYRGDYNDPLSLNRYVYVVNNPLIYIDPDGYWPKWLEEFGKNLWDETVNFGKTLGATFHGGAEAIVDTLVGIVQNPINAVKQAYYGGKYIDNELYHAIGLKADESYKADAKEYGTNFMEIASQYNVINMATGIFNNFKTTLDPKNLESFVDKDTPYSEKVAYANSATKTAMTVYGTYKVGQGIYNKVTQVNTAGTLKTYGNTNLSNTALYRNSPYSGQIVAPCNFVFGNPYKAPFGGGGITDTITVNGRTIEFGHGGRHLEGTDLSPNQVNTVLAKDVINKNLELNRSTEFTTHVNGVEINYRASQLLNGNIRIGTYFMSKGGKK
ncbi:MAG: RHS repeat-associated core domain-containing protein, partial [Bacilli bacterium]|nr:RHS repeat-associated core domain-containing protein [Bacilli bacterium]